LLVSGAQVYFACGTLMTQVTKSCNVDHVDRVANFWINRLFGILLL
jgi:hypothetical protein